MTKPATDAWKDMLAKIGGMWVGKTIKYQAANADEASRMREMAFNAAASVHPKAKIHTTIVPSNDGSHQLVITKEQKNGE